jgi:hypothetical protein
MGNQGISVLAVVLVILGCMFVAAIALPGFMRACGCNETPAMTTIRLLRSINSSQSAYSSACAEGAFAPALEDLLKPPLTGGTPFIGWKPMPPRIEGYVVTFRIPAGGKLSGQTCNGGGRAKGYFVEARPTEVDEHSRFFATDERGTIYQSNQPISEDMSGARPIQ